MYAAAARTSNSLCFPVSASSNARSITSVQLPHGMLHLAKHIVPRVSSTTQVPMYNTTRMAASGTANTVAQHLLPNHHWYTSMPMAPKTIPRPSATVATELSASTMILPKWLSQVLLQVPIARALLSTAYPKTLAAHLY